MRWGLVLLTIEICIILELGFFSFPQFFKYISYNKEKAYHFAEILFACFVLIYKCKLIILMFKKEGESM